MAAGHKQQRGEGEEVPASNAALPQNCVYPSDLVPFTRKKLFLIVESDNSAVFKVS